MLLSLVASFYVASPVAALAQGQADTLSGSFRKAAQRALPSVVGVVPDRRVDSGDPGDPSHPSKVDVGGSGLVVDAIKGFILTNEHVVPASGRVVVVLPGGRQRKVISVRRDPKSDLALLTIDPAGLVAASWGDPNSLDVGDWVLAVGQPFGLVDSVTAGIVSGKCRGSGFASYEDLIQTDAAINPGNSGGPLVNLKGEVVGINASLKTVGGGFEGVGFAIPAPRARRVASDLAEFGAVRRASVGVQVRSADPDDLERRNLTGGALVTGVTPGGPAAESGLRVGDLVVEVAGRSLAGPGGLQSAIEEAPIGLPLSVRVARGDKSIDFRVVPRSQPVPAPTASADEGGNAIIP